MANALRIASTMPDVVGAHQAAAMLFHKPSGFINIGDNEHLAHSQVFCKLAGQPPRIAGVESARSRDICRLKPLDKVVFDIQSSSEAAAPTLLR